MVAVSFPSMLHSINEGVISSSFRLIFFLTAIQWHPVKKNQDIVHRRVIKKIPEEILSIVYG